MAKPTKPVRKTQNFVVSIRVLLVQVVAFCWQICVECSLEIIMSSRELGLVSPESDLKNLLLLTKYLKNTQLHIMEIEGDVS